MTVPENHSGALPKYIQLSEYLVREINAGRLMEGERLPPERTLATELNTSVGTLRKALAELENRGMLHRIQGSGNYIRKATDIGSVYAMFRLELHEGGGLPTARILNVTTLAKPNDLPEFGRSSNATRIRRTRYLNDIAIAVEEIWLDAGVGSLTREALSDSLYQTYHKRLNLWVSRAEDRVSHAPQPDWTPTDFGKTGQISGYVERFSWADDPSPVEFSRTWFDTQKCVYVQRLK